MAQDRYDLQHQIAQVNALIQTVNLQQLDDLIDYLRTQIADVVTHHDLATGAGKLIYENLASQYRTAVLIREEAQLRSNNKNK